MESKLGATEWRGEEPRPALPAVTSSFVTFAYGYLADDAFAAGTSGKGHTIDTR